MCASQLSSHHAAGNTHDRAGLRRTAQMMAQEIELSSGNLSLVTASHNKLSTASSEYEKQHGRLRTSKALIRQIRWHERKEDILLYAGLAFFALCVTYVVSRRTLQFVPALPFEWLQQALAQLWLGAVHLATWGRRQLAAPRAGASSDSTGGLQDPTASADQHSNEL